MYANKIKNIHIAYTSIKFYKKKFSNSKEQIHKYRNPKYYFYNVPLRKYAKQPRRKKKKESPYLTWGLMTIIFNGRYSPSLG